MSVGQKQVLRRKETKLKKYRDIVLEKKDEHIEGKTIIEWETELSLYNRKSLTIRGFKKYIKKGGNVSWVL